jgi:hypothetical protein
MASAAVHHLAVVHCLVVAGLGRVRTCDRSVMSGWLYR